MDLGIGGGGDGERLISPRFEFWMGCRARFVGVRCLMPWLGRGAGGGDGERFRRGPIWQLPSPLGVDRLRGGRDGESTRPSLFGARECREFFFRRRGGDWSRTGVRDFVSGSKKEKS